MQFVLVCCLERRSNKSEQTREILSWVWLLNGPQNHPMGAMLPEGWWADVQHHVNHQTVIGYRPPQGSHLRTEITQRPRDLEVSHIKEVIIGDSVTCQDQRLYMLNSFTKVGFAKAQLSGYKASS